MEFKVSKMLLVFILFSVSHTSFLMKSTKVPTICYSEQCNIAHFPQGALAKIGELFGDRQDPAALSLKLTFKMKFGIRRRLCIGKRG